MERHLDCRLINAAATTSATDGTCSAGTVLRVNTTLISIAATTVIGADVARCSRGATMNLRTAQLKALVGLRV